MELQAFKEIGDCAVHGGRIPSCCLIRQGGSQIFWTFKVMSSNGKVFHSGAATKVDDIAANIYPYDLIVFFLDRTDRFLSIMKLIGRA